MALGSLLMVIHHGVFRIINDEWKTDEKALTFSVTSKITEKMTFHQYLPCKNCLQTVIFAI